MEPHPPDKTDRMLAMGRPSGPELDALWAAVAPAVVPQPEPAWKRWWKVGVAFLPLAAAATAAVVWIGRPHGEDDFTPRGVAAAELGWIEASCGVGAKPCVAGSPIYFRVVDAERSGVAYLVVEQQPKRILVANAAAFKPGSTALPVKLIPEVQDVENGITLRTWLVEKSLDPQVLQQVMETGDAPGQGPVVRLKVVP